MAKVLNMQDYKLRNYKPKDYELNEFDEVSEAIKEQFMAIGQELNKRQGMSNLPKGRVCIIEDYEDNKLVKTTETHY